MNRRRILASLGGWANPYVTDGLVAMFDGEWNAGGGVHDPNATVWKNLIGESDLTGHGNITWGDNFLLVDNRDGKSGFASAAFDVGLNPTYEICATTPEATSFQTMPVYITGITPAWGIYGSPKQFYIWFTSGTTLGSSNTPKFRSYSVRFNNATGEIDGFANGEYTSSTSRPKWTNARVSNLRVSYGTSTNDLHIFKTWCVRVYNRNLTSDEIAANYAIDKARFGLT